MIFSNSEIDIASKSTIMPFQITLNKNSVIHFGSIKNADNLQYSSAIQIQPSSNLFLSTLISPMKNNNNLSIHYHLLAGYLTDWKLSKNSSTMIKIGIHRYRFSDNNDSRWISLSLDETFFFKVYSLNLTWNRLIAKKWERNTMSISSQVNLFNNCYFKPGALFYFTPISFSPFILFSIKI